MLKFSEVIKARAKKEPTNPNTEFHIKIEHQYGIASVGCTYGRYYESTKDGFNPFEDNDD